MTPNEMVWRPISTCPESGFFLVYEDGAIRTMHHDNGKWEPPGMAVRLDEYGDRQLVDGAFVHDIIYEPTHWMPLPSPPNGEE